MLLGELDVAQARESVKIVIFRTGRLFGHDETRLYAESLRAALASKRHSVELTTLPFSNRIADLVAETAAYRLLDFRHGIDLCIAIGPFSYAINHANKRVWLFSQYSPFYELWESPYGALTASNTNLGIRDSILALDRLWLGEARAVFSTSQSVSSTLAQHIGVGARVLLPTPPKEFLREPSGYEDYLLCAGTLTDTARFGLVIKAFSKTKTPVKLVIMGFEAAREEREYLQRLIAEASVAERIEFVLNPSYQQIRDRAASSLGFVSIPFRAGNPDLFFLTAAALQRPVLTSRDSGELASLVEHSIGGYVVDPEDAAVAEAMDDLYRGRKSAARMGKALADKLATLLPSWDTIADELGQ
jgi:glycosyltransferase involved in cell wall biosynthesis